MERSRAGSWSRRPSPAGALARPSAGGGRGSLQLVVELLEVQPQAGGGALAATWEGGNYGQHDAAAAIKNRALHLLVSPIGPAH